MGVQKACFFPISVKSNHGRAGGRVIINAEGLMATHLPIRSNGNSVNRVPFLKNNFSLRFAQDILNFQKSVDIGITYKQNEG